LAHKLRRKHVSSAIEKRILTSMIVSTQFNQEIVHLLNLDYFTNSFIRKVARWCVDFFQSYEVAPFNHIQDIFNEKQVELPEEDADLIQKILIDISTKYELDQGLNVAYSVDQALRFFKKRELEITNGNIKILLEKDDVDGAEEQLNQFTKISKVTAGWIDPFNPEYCAEVFQSNKAMFKFPGQLGTFLGGMERGWLIAFAAGFKKGKSFMLQELAIAAIQQRLKVAFFSLEMYRASSNERIYKRLLGAGADESGPAVYPCFDCACNQDGSCNKPERTNGIPLTTNGTKPPFSYNSKYTPCTYCRTECPEDYQLAWWKELIERPAFNKTNVQKHLDALSKLYRNSYRFKNYPRFSANTSDIIRDLDILERTDNFVPDIIVVDYADILKTEDSGPSTGVSQLDDTWKSLSKLAGERHALVVTASQITRAGMDKKQVKVGDTALWVGKTAHLDVFGTLQQTPEEKKDGIMRVGLMAHRYADFDENSNCMILQKLDYGQVCLDSEIMK